MIEYNLHKCYLLCVKFDGIFLTFWFLNIKFLELKLIKDRSDEKRQLYLSGDFLLPRISPNISDNFFDPLDDRLGEYFKYLNDIQTIGSETKVFPCHDWPFKDGSERAKNLIKHHNHRLKLILDELKNRSITIMDSIEIIFDRKIGDEQMHFAIGEARAHLIHLDVTGQAKSEMDDKGTVHYSCL